MFLIAFLIGIFSYTILILGINGMLARLNIIILVIVFLLILILRFRNLIIVNTGKLKIIINLANKKQYITKNKLIITFFILFFILAVVNLIGALGPELAFDALWYHLTIPKIWLNEKTIFYIPGGLLYYSAMPKLGELLYLAGMALGNEITAKLIHYSFGLLTCLAIFKLSRRIFNPVMSIISAIIFYSNLVVGWESITAYVDLVRSFYEVLALWAFIIWIEKAKLKWLIISAVMLGFAISVKLLAIGSIIIYSILIVFLNFYKYFNLKSKSRSTLLNSLSNLLIFWSITLLIPSPWLLFSYINTANPVYPFFSEIYKIVPQPVNLIYIFGDIWDLLIHSPDPLSPVYIIFLPLIVYLFSKFDNRVKIISLFSLLGIIIWYFTPRTGGGRFIIPFLPSMSIICSAVIYYLSSFKNKKLFYNLSISIIILVVIITIVYRSGANFKYLPVIFGFETKEKFLTDNLNFDFGDFYDTDGYFKKNIKKNDKVLLIGFHNLYYIDFGFVDSTWLKKEDEFDYIAVQKSILPEKYRKWKLIYENKKTFIKLYKR